MGSYPAFQQGVTVSLIGRNEARVREIGDEVIAIYFSGSILVSFLLSHSIGCSRDTR